MNWQGYGEGLMIELSIDRQTFCDLTLWLINPDEHSAEQLKRLCDEELCLPLMSLANQYWLIGVLTHSLKNSDVWGVLPEQLRGYLLEVETLYENRNKQIEVEVVEVCALLDNENIDVILMKGAASLFNGATQPISKRYMKDIDLLIPEDQQQKAYELLKRNGYAQDADYFEINANDAHHSPPLLKNNTCYIELHRWLLVKHLNQVLETKAVWSNTQNLQLSDRLWVKELSPTHQVVLSIAHSELQNGGYDQCHIDLHQLMNLHSIVSHYKSAIDWQVVKQHFAESGQRKVLQTTLYNAYQLACIHTPITDFNDKFSKRYFNKCITRYVKRQGIESFYTVVMEQLYFYKKRNIKLTYGGDVSLWYVRGAFKQLKNHIRKVFNEHHMKLFVRRLIP